MADSGSERPELTAYILNELPDEERTQLELVLDQDSSLRTESNELRSLSDLIRSELEAEERLQLLPQQRNAILDAAPSAGEEKVPKTATAKSPLPPSLGDRLEFLAVFLALMMLGLLVPRLPHYAQLLKILIRARFQVHEVFEDEPPSPPEVPDAPAWGFNALQLEIFLASALIAMAYYAWVRTAPPRPAPKVQAYLVAALIFSVIQLVLLRLLAAA